MPYFNFKSKVEALREYISHGLTYGLGQPSPGKGCIEAAVCFVLGEPHGDRPSCVGDPDRKIATELNDAGWSSDEARAAGMVDLAVAHLGSDGMSQADRLRWVTYIAEQNIRRVLPMALRAVGLEAEARLCETDGSADAAASAVSATLAAEAAAARSRDAAAAAAAAAADASATLAARRAADAAAAAARAAEAAAVEWAVDAEIAASADAVADAVALSARAAEASVARAAGSDRDAPLREAARIVVEAYDLVPADAESPAKHRVSEGSDA